MTTTGHAFSPSFNAFFNALLRELGPFPFRARQPHDAGEPSDPIGHFTIANQETGECLWVPCHFRATLGRHILGTRAILWRQQTRRLLRFAEAVDWCLDLPELRRRSTRAGRDRFRSRVLNSDRNLAHITVRLSATLDRCFQAPLNFIEAEQALMAGHSIHPCPKDRGAMSTSEAVRFAPEFSARFALAWYSVNREQLSLHHGGRDTPDAMVASLLEAGDGHMPARMAQPPGHCLIPCHPFQHRHWQSNPGVRALLDSGQLRFLGMGEPGWRATSSLRSIWSPRHAWMLKFSLSLRLTNSIRHLQPAEALRGPGLCRLCRQEPLRSWLRSRPYFHILDEPTVLGLKGPDGELVPETLVVFRANPFCGSHNRHTEVLATLLQDDPRNGLSRLGQRLLAAGTDSTGAQWWLRRYLDVVVAPLLEAQAEFGLLFGAHQQNLVLELERGLWPRALWFRDCQGTGFTSLARARLGASAQALIPGGDNQPPDELGIRLFCYYLMINATFNVITALAAAGLCPEATLRDQLRHWLQARLDAGVRDDRALRYLLESPQLHAKANFLCSLKNLNENTLRDIASIYHPLPNPLMSSSSNHPPTRKEARQDAFTDYQDLRSPV